VTSSLSNVTTNSVTVRCHLRQSSHIHLAVIGDVVDCFFCSCEGLVFPYVSGRRVWAGAYIRARELDTNLFSQNSNIDFSFLSLLNLSNSS
jgi:hypothetical protein